MRISLILVVLILFSCSNRNNENSVSEPSEKNDEILANQFLINGLNLRSKKSLLVSLFGNPDKESSLISSKDTLTSLYYFYGSSEIAFIPNRDSIFFSHALFKDSVQIIKNEYGSFSNKTKLDVMKVLFPDSYNSRSKRDHVETLYLRLQKSDSWLRLEFTNGYLSAIFHDF